MDPETNFTLDLQHRLNSAHVYIFELEEKRDHLEKQLQLQDRGPEKEIEELKKQLKNRGAEIDKIEFSITDFIHRNERLEKEIEELKNKLASSHGHIEDQKILLDNQEIELDEQHVRIEAQDRQIKRLKDTADNAVATANIWIKKHKEKRKENNRLKSRLEALEEENKAIRACLKLTL